MTDKKLPLTPERQKIIAASYQEYLKVGLSTAPANFDDAEVAITKLYASIGKKRPHFVRLSSPLAAELYINLLTTTWPKDFNRGQLGGQLGDQLGDQLWGQLWGQLRDQLGGQLRGQLGGQLRGQKLNFMGTWFAGQWDYIWAWAETGRRLGTVYTDKQNEQLDAHCQVMRSIGWWYPFDDFCIITDRPEAILRDDQNRLHCETGMALKYRDGTGMHSWHGLRIPAEWIENKASLTAKTALTWPNIEQRRAACEILGWGNVLAELKAKTIDKDDDPEVGELLEVTLPDIGKEKFLKVRCGTGRTFTLPVPPDMKTALQANCWTYNISEDVLKSLAFRT